MSELPRSTDVAIVGGGFAGMATAWWLARLGVKDVIVLERESELGRYASGRCAGLGRQIADDDLTSALTVFGAAQMRRHFPHAWTQSGGILTFEDKDLARGYAGRAHRLEVAIVRMTRGDVLAVWPQLESLPFEVGISVPSDGVIDIVALLAGYAESVRVLRRVGVERVEPAGRGVKLTTGRGELTAKVVVDASGAWAGTTTGDPLLDSFKRHVYTLEAVPPARAPFVWHIGSCELYMRPDGDRILVSPCDTTPVPPGDQQPDAAGEAQLHSRLQSSSLRKAKIARSWACQRTFARHTAMRLGRDETRPWLVWAVGLGGHGATASAAVGEIVANAVVDALGAR